MEEFARSRREDKRITQELTEQLSKTFITPLEREDIQELAAALYKIPKTVEKIGERILICPQDLRGHSFKKQVELLDQAAEAVLAMVKQLREGMDVRTAREMNAKLQAIEGEAVITLALFTGTKAGRFDNLPAWLSFLYTPVFLMPLWVKILCALTMAAGTGAGGWRIIRTLGHRMVKLQPVHGFAAETTAALIIQGASIYGIPLSTTHVISTSIMGVGAVKRFSGVKWTVVERIVWAWIFTLPATGLIGYLLVRLAAML